MQNLTNSTFTDNELNILEKYLSESKCYLEYGTGYSTRLACQNNIERMVAIESDLNFINDKVMVDSVVAKNIGHSLTLQHINVGEVGNWGGPTNRDHSYLYPLYALTPLNLNHNFDLIFVDGLFRGACVLSSILHFPEATILVHDFTIRKRYQFLLKYIDVIETADTMIVCKRKKSITDKQIIKLLNKKLYWPSDERFHRRAIALIKQKRAK